MRLLPVLVHHQGSDIAQVVVSYADLLAFATRSQDQPDHKLVKELIEENTKLGDEVVLLKRALAQTADQLATLELACSANGVAR